MADFGQTSKAERSQTEPLVSLSVEKEDAPQLQLCKLVWNNM